MIIHTVLITNGVHQAKASFALIERKFLYWWFTFSTIESSIFESDLFFISKSSLLYITIIFKSCRKIQKDCPKLGAYFISPCRRYGAYLVLCVLSIICFRIPFLLIYQVLSGAFQKLTLYLSFFVLQHMLLFV